ncbi:MAG TPA: hypothetical protein VKA19_11500 [Alphaproteobacteria bacterium]|nr:hypothetical protein [Alphaproteobacteria bacterium]
MQSLKIKGRFQVTLSKQRTEYHSDDLVLVHDAKVVGHVPVEDLVPLLGVESVREVIGTLWDAENHDLTLLNVSEVRFGADKFEGMCGTLGATKFTEAKASKFILRPGAGGGELEFQISVPHPATNLIGKFAALLGEVHKLDLMPMQADIDDDDQGRADDKDTQAEPAGSPGGAGDEQ